MGLTKNDVLRNQQADDLGTIFDGGTLEIRSGTRPADPDSAATGTLLVSITIPTPAFNAASGGSISKTGTWTGTAVADGTATWARFKDSGATMNMDADVAESSADLVISDSSVVTDQDVDVVSLTITIPDGV